MNVEQLLSEDKLLEIAKGYLTDKGNFENTRGKGYKGENGLLYAISKKGFKKALKKDHIDDFGMNKMPVFIDGPTKPGVKFAMWPDYWNRLKREIYYLICTNDKKYRDVRRVVKSEGKKAQTAIVSTIAAAVAVHLGIAAGALLPFCALILFSTLRVGKSTFCAAESKKAREFEAHLAEFEAEHPKRAKLYKKAELDRQEAFLKRVRKTERMKAGRNQAQ